MNSIEFRKVSKNYGSKEIIKCLNLDIRQGERMVLLGPSGCGKTTILRMVAGLESITSGTISMNNKIINDVPAGERNIAMVFQSYALFPHMSVWDNITFGLKIQKFPTHEIEARTKQALEILNLTGYEARKPKELSGGQKQRVALCRALVKQSPFFLLDEPLSNLDAQLRQQARSELIKLHDIYKPTMIYVTHDQTEAMTIANRIAIVNNGDLQQLDTPENIYNHPANTFVAKFLGTPPMNILKAQVNGNSILLGNSDWLEIPPTLSEKLKDKKSVLIGIRPEKCYLSATPMVKAGISYVENLGNQLIVKIKMSSAEELNVCISDGCYGTDVQGYSFDWENVSWFEDGSEKNLFSL